MEEPTSNIRYSCTGHIKPDPKFANAPAEDFIGKFCKIGFDTTETRIMKEWMWVKVESTKNGKCIGKLDNDPIYIRNLSDGDEITFYPNEIVDVVSL